MKNLKVIKHILNNGLNVLIVPRKVIPKVSVQLWYNVGSKDEKSGQKGIAHLIEHMIFKGTEKLSECDINLITHKLSGYCNAFTSYDYTGYLFDFPSQNWQESLKIMADCMNNCTFKQEFLNSELKAVIQELKMFKDDYITSIVESLITTMFPDHPYHHPIIGYKQDLWSLNREALINFYKQHYLPNNATLIIVGDVDEAEVMHEVKKNFGSIKPNLNYTKDKFYHSPDLKNYSITIYRDIKQPAIVLAWVVPGLTQGKDYLIEIVLWIIGSGRGSRLYKKLVDELELVTELQVFNYSLFDAGILFLYFQPKSISKINEIIDIINTELMHIVKKGLSPQEINRAIKKTEMDYLDLLEDNQKQAYEIGQYFLATQDEQFLYKFTDYPKEDLEQEVVSFIDTYLKINLMSQGRVLPLQEKDKKLWLQLQEISDMEDQHILSRKERSVDIEPGQCVFNVEIKPTKKFNYPKAKSTYLTNGLKLLYYNNQLLPKIDLILDFKEKYYYDPIELEGLSSFVAAMLQEGTKNYSESSFADTLESYGMTLESYPGVLSMSMLSNDLIKGLELLNETLTLATFKEKSIEKVREVMLANINQFWDQPTKFVNQILKQEIYKNHPYSKNQLGTIESIKKINREDLINFYHKYISPKDARLCLSGNMERYEIKDVMQDMLFSWKPTEIPQIDFPHLKEVKAKEINYEIMRDQVVLCYGGLSVDRLNPDYDKLLLFDQIFSGGILGSMSSKLFDLREKSGLFYTISGSLVYNVDLQPGMIIVKTIVSNDRLKEAEKAIEHTINYAIEDVSDSEFEEAKRAITNSLVDNFSSNEKTAVSLLLKDYYNFPADYFDKRADQLAQITKEQMQNIVKKYLTTEKMIKIRAGRV